MLRRGRENAYRALLGFATVAVLGCQADTSPGRTLGPGNRPVPPSRPVAGAPVAGGGGSGALVPPEPGGAGSTGVIPGAGSSASVAGAGSAPSLAGTGGVIVEPPPVVPMEERVFNAGTDPARNMVQAGQVCRRLAQIQCAGEAYCCDQPGRDVAACEATMIDGCANGLYLDEITLNPKTGFRQEKAAVAFEELETLASRCDMSIGAYGLSGTGLLSMLEGTVAMGGSCDPGLTTDEAAGAAALASCQGVATTSCLPRSALSWRCEARGPAGGMCFTDLNCQEGLFCPNPNLQFGQTMCTPRKVAGQPCAAPNECASLSCRAGACEVESVQAMYCLMK